jgi:hypothetical protein
MVKLSDEDLELTEALAEQITPVKPELRHHILYLFAMDQGHQSSQPNGLWSEESGPVHALHSELILDALLTRLHISMVHSHGAGDLLLRLNQQSQECFHHVEAWE